jgi:hypothetical protein
MREKEVLFVDIDGVSSSWRASNVRPHVRPDGALLAAAGAMRVLSGAAGNHLLGLMSSFDLVSCGCLEEQADEHPPRALGLPGGLAFISRDRNPRPR